MHGRGGMRHRSQLRGFEQPLSTKRVKAPAPPTSCNPQVSCCQAHRLGGFPCPQSLRIHAVWVKVRERGKPTAAAGVALVGRDSRGIGRLPWRFGLIPLLKSAPSPLLARQRLKETFLVFGWGMGEGWREGWTREGDDSFKPSLIWVFLLRQHASPYHT